MTVPACVNRPVIASPATSSARPKSRIFGNPSFVTAMLPGFRSRWSTPCRWAASRASAIAAPNDRTSSSGRGPSRQPGFERAPGHELHHQKVVVFLRIEIKDGRDAGVRDPGQGQRFATKPLQARLVADRSTQEHLDRDRSVQPRVVGLPDFAHSARAETLDQTVPAERFARSRTRMSIPGPT